MSPTQKDRNLQSESGRSLPPPPATNGEPLSFAETVADALRREFGGTSAAVKVVVRLTRANERAVKNWFTAKNGPSGENLMILLRHSDEVLESVLQMAGRQDLIVARKLTGAREKLREMLAMIDELQAN
jgi:hypothetical protein